MTTLSHVEQTEHVDIYHFVLDNGRRAHVWPLYAGRARLSLVNDQVESTYDDEW